MRDLVSRPIRNIKQLDFKMVALGFIITLIVPLVFAGGDIYKVIDSLTYIFSPNFYPTEVTQNSDMISNLSIYRSSQFELVNKGKIVLWVLMGIGLLYLLFKKPFNEKSNN